MRAGNRAPHSGIMRRPLSALTVSSSSADPPLHPCSAAAVPINAPTAAAASVGINSKRESTETTMSGATAVGHRCPSPSLGTELAPESGRRGRQYGGGARWWRGGEENG